MRDTASGTPTPTISEHPLAPGDRIRSAHTGRVGHVVRTYNDGSVAVQWGADTPQAEGLADVIMPRRLLVKLDKETLILSTDPEDIEFVYQVLREIVDDHPELLPPDLHARATEALERLESVPFSQGAQS